MPTRADDVTRAARDALPVDLIRKGIRNPEQVSAFVLGKLFPDSRWSPNWRREDGYITFEDGGFAGGSPSRWELSARIYREARLLEEVLAHEQFDRALEVGCGYGRLSGWIADRATRSIGIDPNGTALRKAKASYPNLAFARSLAEVLPFPGDSFDLAVSWAVLQHVRPDSIEAVAAEIRRVLEDDATILLCERTAGEPGRTSWVRSVEEYRSLFAPYELRTVTDRPAEPTFDYARYADTIVFTGESTAERASEARSNTQTP